MNYRSPEGWECSQLAKAYAAELFAQRRRGSALPGILALVLVLVAASFVLVAGLLLLAALAVGSLGIALVALVAIACAGSLILTALALTRSLRREDTR